VTGSDSSRPVPSWPQVIATTFRLWFERRVLRPRRDRPVRSRRGRAAAGLTAIALLAGGAAWIAATVVRDDGSRPAAHATDVQPRPELAAAAATRQEAAAWVAAQVSHGVIVACDPLMCAALERQGFPAANLAVIGTGSGDPLGSGLVISTYAVRSQLGLRLARVYAPLVIASFGSGQDLVQVRVMAPGGAAGYLSAVAADVQARKVAGDELARNMHIDASPAASAELAAGRVDSRLLITLAALAHKFPVRISGFSDPGPGAGSAVPLRVMVITAPSRSYLNQLLAFLYAQRPPLRATVSEQRAGRQYAVQIEFSAPSPVGLLTGGSAG
jgi:hypothetical protein